MTLREWIEYPFDPYDIIFNASPVDGSDFITPYPIGISVFLTDDMPGPDAIQPFLLGECFDRDILCSAAFRTDTTNSRGRVRLKLADDLKLAPWVVQYLSETGKRSLRSYSMMNLMQRSKFTLSPRGYGLDCHRNYEALLFKCVPIITPEWSEPLREKYDGLPVIFTDRFLFTEDDLEDQYEEMLDKQYDFNKLSRSYWQRRRPDMYILYESIFWLKRFRKFENVADYFKDVDPRMMANINPEPYPGYGDED